MRTLIALLCFIGFAGSHAQDLQPSQVPAAIVTALQTKFPTATKIKWKQKDADYKAEFKVDSRGHDVWFDKTGKIKKHKEDFPKSQLPAAVKEKIASEFKDFSIDDADKVDAEGKIYYQIDLKNAAGDKRKVLFTPEGKIETTNVD
ncbi:MAG TPA: PepSY-like domain-containing protein [Ohtaekwangia sp.]|uniref:PepSY-like domain-containing protein n=1 Tax=Ohtaekwangia sp. TaxID=2066019 RepID=UPI002F959F64